MNSENLVLKFLKELNQFKNLNLVPKNHSINPLDKMEFKSQSLSSSSSNVTKLLVYYSNNDKLSCHKFNDSFLKCMDNALETKLNMKLSFLYKIELHPLYVCEDKVICINKIHPEAMFDCSFITKNDTSRKKIVWKLNISNVNQSLEARSSVLNTINLPFKNATSTSIINQREQSEMKESLFIFQSNFHLTLNVFTLSYY